MAMLVTLTEEELRRAEEVGRRRYSESIRKQLKDKHGFKGNAEQSLAINVLGAKGELACAKALGLPWDGSVNTFRSRTDLPGLEVRTRAPHYYDLLVREDDANDRRYVLVTGRGPKFWIHGWMLAAEAKQARWLKPYGNREEAYFVPKNFLHPLEPNDGRVQARSAS